MYFVFFWAMFVGGVNNPIWIWILLALLIRLDDKIE